jgi:hypothetical protein
VPLTSPASAEARPTHMTKRYAISRRLAATVVPTAPKADPDRLARVLVVLSSSSAMRLWVDHLGSSVDEAADDIDWLIRTVVTAAPKRKKR